MKEMSVRDLVTTYGRSLEQQIQGRGSTLACRDEALWHQAEGLLKDGVAMETHCLGLDPLRVMEESLAASAAAGAGRVKARGGLRGLAKAFEVLEQAALNLYLGPWRDEYKVVKMYSGMFTHYIKPVLSMPQIEKLFGLLGYQSSSPRHEQLRLQAPHGGSASPDDLLCLSCAFFLARCECRLLLAALGKHMGDAQWELSVVRERQRGNGLQVALDNAKKTLGVNQPPMERFDGEADVDLYTDEHLHRGQSEAVVNDNGSPCSLTWVSQSGASAATNGVAPLSCSSASLLAREHVCISTLSCQLAKTSPPESEAAQSARPGRRPCEEESRFDHGDSPLRSLQAEAMGLKADAADHRCSCLQAKHLCLKLCTDCNITHDIACDFLQPCYTEKHRMVFPDDTPGGLEEELRVLASPPGGSPTLSGSSTAMSSLALCDDPKAMMACLHPIAYHECCDLAQLDPQALCVSCGVFHSGSCREIDFCQTHHEIRPLGVCSCGRACARKPLVLCRYCGNEYCSDCWYRNPVVCSCGQTFDQSSSV